MVVSLFCGALCRPGNRCKPWLPPGLVGAASPCRLERNLGVKSVRSISPGHLSVRIIKALGLHEVTCFRSLKWIVTLGKRNWSLCLRSFFLFCFSSDLVLLLRNHRNGTYSLLYHVRCPRTWISVLILLNPGRICSDLCGQWPRIWISCLKRFAFGHQLVVGRVPQSAA